MHPPPLPLVPLLLSSVFLADTTATGLDPWKLLERWGIAFVMGLIAWLLWKRSERQDRESRQRVEALEKERLEVSKALLSATETHASNMQSLVVGSMRTQTELTQALKELREKVHAIPCASDRRIPGTTP